MISKNKVIPPNIEKFQSALARKVSVPDNPDNLTVSFAKFKLEPICLRGKFNNHFKDNQHFCSIAANFLGTIIPKITSHPYKEVCEGSSEGRALHFHTIDESHREIVREILKAYNFADYVIDQMFEGNDIFEFSASLGHIHAARIICHKINNVLYFLFLDTNHHIYFNEKYAGESLFFEDCPMYINNVCEYMPSECFAVSYIDEEKLKEGFGYNTAPGE